MQAEINFHSPLLPDALRFPSFREVISTHDLSKVIPALQRVEELCMAGNYAAGFIAYEAAPAFDAALRTHPPVSGLPLLFFGIHPEPEILPNAGKAVQRNKPTTSHNMQTGETAVPGDWHPLWSESEYAAAFATVQARIRAGDTYQVNLTFPLRADWRTEPYSAYQLLRQVQNGDYATFLDLGDWQILSLSPELFFQRQRNHLHTMPMKGTAARGLMPSGDRLASERLLNSEKERAENLMIVDLLRNDLGRLARPGGVHVPALLEARRYPTLWQLTSTIDAELPAQDSSGAPGLVEIFTALFPCGSVTGAPKASTMHIIHELEPEPRGVYCGTMGVVLPGGDCVFNVPIRTLQIHGTSAVYSVGSGLVSDGNASAEYAECLLKAKVLTASQEEFSLLETILWQPIEEFILLPGHLRRLRGSADFFLRDFVEQDALQALRHAVRDKTTPQRLRLLVASDGTSTVEASEYTPLPVTPVQVRLASRPVDVADWRLYHKTTSRALYDGFRQELADAFEMLLFNERGELTEGTISNIALRLDGRWYTPPVQCGLLAGVLREEMLQRGELSERILLRADLNRAEGLRLLNSVRGVLDAELPVRPIVFDQFL